MAGVDKFREGNGWGPTGNVTFSLENYAIEDRAHCEAHGRQQLPARRTCATSMPGALAIVLLAVGAWVVVGLFTEFALLAAGLTVLSLGFGLAALPDDTEVVYIGIHVLVVAAALATCRNKGISLDGLFFRRKAD